MRRRLAAATVTAILASEGVADAAPEACACKHLESVQQELENAEYLQRFYVEVAKRLEVIEKRQAEIDKDPTHKNAGLSTKQQTAAVRDEMFNRERKLPNPRVKGYSGPSKVDFDSVNCSNRQVDLDGLRDGASCKELGDFSLAHENGHRAICLAMNKAKKNSYVSQAHSLDMLEESRLYGEQAKSTRALLKKLIDGAKFRVSEKSEMRVVARQGYDATYAYETAAFDLEGKSSPGADKWTLKGESRRSGVIKQIVIPGMQCTPYGKLNDKVTTAMTLDGLSMSMNILNTSALGDIGMRCRTPDGQGFGQSMRPVGETGSGDVFKNARVKFSSEFIQNIADTPAGKILRQGGMSVSGASVTKVELICPAK